MLARAVRTTGQQISGLTDVLGPFTLSVVYITTDATPFLSCILVGQHACFEIGWSR